MTPVIHCDLKPSNVLLDEEMVAHLGEFGIAQIITEDSSCKPNSTSSLGLKGTMGYSAPGLPIFSLCQAIFHELSVHVSMLQVIIFSIIYALLPKLTEYGVGNRVSAYGDIYSFGVLLLEMMTEKRPTDLIFNNGLSLRNLVEMALPGRVMDILDKKMAAEQDDNGALHCSWITSEPKKWQIECITCQL